ncbi:MAG: DUF4445 domain-containing protein, partial [Burkholderiales bacterium]|nr:DUF4445 domain-containing protein [Burkholderiales bacterium]
MTIHLSTPEGNREISHEPGLSVLEILTREGYPVNSSCGGNGVCGKCSVKILENIPPSAGDFARLSAQSIEAGFRLSCTIRPQGDLHVVLPAMRLAWRRMKDEEFLPVEPASGKTCAAVDLGTTHIRISLWDGGRRLEGRAFLNPQRAWGADLLTRLAQAHDSTKNALKIRKLAENAISGAISEMALHHAVNIDEKWLVGNTAMMALLSGRNSDLLLDPDNWTKRLDCAPIEGDIRFVPPLGGFVGSDILAGIEATHLSESPPGTLLVDFGTNSEMALWDGKRILATSAAGGPAFEGGGISCGMPAEAGAIFRV